MSRVIVEGLKKNWVGTSVSSCDGLLESLLGQCLQLPEWRSFFRALVSRS